MTDRKQSTMTIRYGSGRLSYNTVRKGILQQKDKLSGRGYRCAWKEDLDLSNGKPSTEELHKKGYMDLGNVILSSFSDGLPVTITIFHRSMRAVLSGENWFYQNEYNRLKKRFSEFEKLTGIHMNLKKTD
jgi:hypothetical protein